MRMNFLLLALQAFAHSPKYILKKKEIGKNETLKDSPTSGPRKMYRSSLMSTYGKGQNGLKLKRFSLRSKPLGNFRCENSIKNKFYGNVRKTIRKVNSCGKKNIPKFPKPIKFQSLMKVLLAREGTCNIPEHLMLSASSIRAQTIRYCVDE